VAELSLFGSFESEGRVTTDLGYEIEVRRLAIEVEALHMEQIAEGEEPEPCHDGHCHGEAPVEEDRGGSSHSIARPGTEAMVELGAEPVAIELGECTAGCELMRGEHAFVGVDLHGLAFDLVAFDPSGSADGVPFSAELILETEVGATIDLPVGDGSPAGVRASVLLAIPATIFDGIDWSTLSTAAASLEQIRTSLEESDAIVVEIDRHDP
jgi:hypothetical protein